MEISKLCGNLNNRASAEDDYIPEVVIRQSTFFGQL